MDLQFLRRLSLLSSIWLSILLPGLLAYLFGFSNLLVSVLHLVYTTTLVTLLKLWNTRQPEPPLDINLTCLETLISILLASSVSILGGTVLRLEKLSMVLSLIYIYVMTDSVFTLLKSVQPDAASPTHGFNRVISLSKPTYFSLLSVITIISYNYANQAFDKVRKPELIIYNFDILDKEFIRSIGTGSIYIILLFPIIFLLGLLPQITTFIIYILEQIDIHLFGSTASTLGIRSAAYSFCRSIIVLLLLYAVAILSIGNQLWYSLFCAILIAFAYLLSRNSTDATSALRVAKRIINSSNPAKITSGIEMDVLDSGQQQHPPSTDIQSITSKIESTMDSICIHRIRNDLIKCFCLAIIVFALHVTSIFTIYHDLIEKIFGLLAVCWGLIFHFIVPHLRRDLPFLCMAKPVLRPKEYDLFEVKTRAEVMWFEKMYFWAIEIEKNIIYPIFWLNVMTNDCNTLRETFGSRVGPLLLVMMSLKLVRQTFNDPSNNYLTLIFTYLFFNFDVARHNFKIFLLNYFTFSIVNLKVCELLLKLQFVYIYLAPWQVPWGSAFHAIAQPFSVPHSGLLFVQAILSTIISAPLQPILGSAIFMMSYVRPVKFWERDYNTNVIDINSTRLVNQLERSRIDSNRLDGIFYEHLTKCLQRKLAADLALGRWGPVSQGDCFIMASDNLNCLVHIVELGNGVCTFQLRGLEFRGTYCQQQEVEAISEQVPQDDGFCCCSPGHLPHMLSFNSSISQHWLAWHVTHTRYVLEGYSISDNAAAPMLQPFDLRRALVTYYVKTIIYFTTTSDNLSKWLQCTEFHEALEHTKDKTYADLDPTFSSSLDLDFDHRLCGVTREKFCSIYFDWIEYCVERVKRDKTNIERAKLIENITCTQDSFLVSLCFGLSLLARRSLSAMADGQQYQTVDALLVGLFALLKGDFRVTSLHDEWIFKEISFFKLVVIPSVRMAMKLHQDHFAAPDDYEDNMMLFEAIAGYQKNLVISHETDVCWRNAVLSGMPSLLTLRLYTDDGSNQYKFIMLNKRYLSFRIIKINRECVRGLWASQQQELIYFRNTDPERGSIQNAKQALRNMINSSCDLPVGYPIYVSPLTTSYIESSKSLPLVI